MIILTSLLSKVSIIKNVSVHTTPEKCEITAIADDLGFLFQANLKKGNLMIIVNSLFSKISVFKNVFRPH